MFDFNTFFLFLLPQCSSSPVHGEFLSKHPPSVKPPEGSLCQFLSQILIFVSVFAVLGLRIRGVCLSAEVGEPCPVVLAPCPWEGSQQFLPPSEDRFCGAFFCPEKPRGCLWGREGSGCTCSNSEGKVPLPGFCRTKEGRARPWGGRQGPWHRCWAELGSSSRTSLHLRDLYLRGNIATMQPSPGPAASPPHPLLAPCGLSSAGSSLGNTQEPNSAQVLWGCWSRCALGC